MEAAAAFRAAAVEAVTGAMALEAVQLEAAARAAAYSAAAQEVAAVEAIAGAAAHSTGTPPPPAGSFVQAVSLLGDRSVAAAKRDALRRTFGAIRLEATEQRLAERQLGAADEAVAATADAAAGATDGAGGVKQLVAVASSPPPPLETPPELAGVLGEARRTIADTVATRQAAVAAELEVEALGGRGEESSELQLALDEIVALPPASSLLAARHERRDSAESI
eukprot:644923-Prymnesium_polylepis.1